MQNDGQFVSEVAHIANDLIHLPMVPMVLLDLYEHMISVPYNHACL